MSAPVAALLVALTALAVGGATLALVVPLLRRHVLDEPNHRSSHRTAVARAGGVGVVAGSVAGWVVAAATGLTVPSASVLGLAVLVAGVGLADDLRHLGAGLRLGLVLVAAAVAVALLGSPGGGAWSLLWAAMAVVGIGGFVNAFNFMDGINAISGLTTLVVAAVLVAVGLAGSDPRQVGAAAAVAGGTVAFLVPNLRPPGLFLGDVGSYFLGFALAVLVWRGIVVGHDPLVLLAPLTPYLADTAATLVRRARHGSRLTEAHREHAYQRLVDAGWSHVATSAVVAVVAVLVTLVALTPLPVGVRVVAMLVPLAAYLALPRLRVREVAA